MNKSKKDLMYYKFCAYGFIKNLQFFEPFLFLYFLESGLNFLQIGILFSVREISINILEIPSGMLADLLGRRKSMIFSFASYIVSFLIFFFMPSFIPAMAAMVLFASGEAFRSGTHKSMIIEHLRYKDMVSEKVNYYGHTRSWSQLGSSLSALIAAFLVFYNGTYRIVFLYSTLPFILDMLLILTYPAYLEGPSTLEREHGKINLKAEFLSIIKAFPSLFSSKLPRKALLTSSLFNGFFKSVKDYIQPMIITAVAGLPLLTQQTEIRRGAVLTGMVYFVLFILTSRASIQAGRFKNEEKTLTGMLDNSYIISALLILLSGISLRFGHSEISIVLFILYYMLMNVRRPVSMSHLSNKVPAAIMATGLSIESQMKTVVVAIMAPLAGLAADKLGIGTALMILSVLVILTYPLVRHTGTN